MSDRIDLITAAILVGGRGTRLRPTLGERQKVIAPIAGRPFLHRLLDQLAAAGIRRVVLCTGYKAEQVAETIGRENWPMRIDFSREPEPLGTAGALRHALPLLNSNPTLVCNGDSFCEVDLAEFWCFHRERNANGSLVVTHCTDTRERGRVTVGGCGSITSFVEKGNATGAGWISAGIYLLRPVVLENIPMGRAVSIERETFPSWVGRGLYAFPTSGKFLDIGTPESYAQGQGFFT